MAGWMVRPLIHQLEKSVLMRKSSNELIKKSLTANRITSVAFTHNYNYNDGDSRNHQNSSKKLMAFAAAAGFFVLENHKKKYLSYAASIDPESQFRGFNGTAGSGQNNGPSRRNTFNFIADVVHLCSPAVVHIEKVINVPFTHKSVPVSNGSGFIVNALGMKLIITNAHVVGNQSHVKVKLQDGRQFQGQVVGIDEARDIAAVQINCRDLPSIPLGASRSLRPGEWVVAIGSPLALSNTVTAGIVSNISRRGKELNIREGEKRDMEYIQTDATITVGNSGGPLVNLDGQVIGINTMMASAGIAFAIPIDYVKEFLTQLRDLQQGRGHLVDSRRNRRWIGVTMLSLNPEIVMQLQSKIPNFPDVQDGVMLHRIQPDSPANLGGMQEFDVITNINGKRIHSTKDVLEALKSSQVLNVTIRRNTRTIVLRIVAEEIVH